MRKKIFVILPKRSEGNAGAVFEEDLFRIILKTI
jgi:hypothetical protein